MAASEPTFQPGTFAGPRGLQMIALNPEPISCKIFFKGAEKFSAPTCLEG